MLDQETLKELGDRAKAKLAIVGNKMTFVEGKKGKRKRVPMRDLTLVGVHPGEVLMLCVYAKPTTDEDRRVCEDLQVGSELANSNADEVYVLAKDLAVLCAAAGYGAEQDHPPTPPATSGDEPVPADVAESDEAAE